MVGGHSYPKLFLFILPVFFYGEPVGSRGGGRPRWGLGHNLLAPYNTHGLGRAHILRKDLHPLVCGEWRLGRPHLRRSGLERAARTSPARMSLSPPSVAGTLSVTAAATAGDPWRSSTGAPAAATQSTPEYITPDPIRFFVLQEIQSWMAVVGLCKDACGRLRYLLLAPTTWTLRLQLKCTLM